MEDLTDIAKDAGRAIAGPLALLMDPRFWLAVVLYTLTVAATTGHYVSRYVTHEARLAEVQRTAAAVAEQAKADALVLADERALHKADLADFETYRKENTDAHAEKDRLIARLRAGTERLRVPVRQVCPAASDAGGPAAGGAGGEGYAELSPDASEFLVNLLQRGDDAIRKHGQVVDRYNRLLAKCTSARTSADPPDDAEAE
jgi:endonuclease YncB( thermonuclease family)